MTENPTPQVKVVARYQPVTHVVTDGAGRFVRVDECSCQLDEHSEPTDSLGCPIHGSPA